MNSENKKKDEYKPVFYRPETGSMQFGDDWPGVFIRGDNAMYFAMQIRMMLENPDLLADLEKNPFIKGSLESLLELLQSAHDHAEDANRQYLIDYDEAKLKI